MAHGIIFVALLLSTLTMSLQEDKVQSINYGHEDDYHDDPEKNSETEELHELEDTTSIPAKVLQEAHIKEPKVHKVEHDREELTTEKQFAKYEVTEFVIDVPDVNTRRVPIITNFTLTRPLNLAGVSNRTKSVGVSVKDEGDEIINTILIPDRPKISNNNQDKNLKGGNHKLDEDEEENEYFSNFDPKVSFENEFDKEFNSDEDDFENFEAEEEPKPAKGFKEHFHSFRKSVVNGFKSVVNKHKDGINDSLHKIVNGPISLFNKLHRKSSDLVKKLHNAVARHKFHDEDDDEGFDDNHGHEDDVSFHRVNHDHEHD